MLAVSETSYNPVLCTGGEVRGTFGWCCMQTVTWVEEVLRIRVWGVTGSDVSRLTVLCLGDILVGVHADCD